MLVLFLSSTEKIHVSVKDCDDTNPHKNKLVNGVCVDECDFARLANDVYNYENGIKEEDYSEESTLSENKRSGWSAMNVDGIDGLILTDGDSGFNSVLFKREVNGQTEYMYVTEGTKSLTDLFENFEQLSGNSEQYALSINNAIAIKNYVVKNGGTLFFTGHSLGGGLASANALATGDIAFTYNAAGLGVSTLTHINGVNGKSLGENLRTNEHLINATVNRNEVLNHYFSKVGLPAVGNRTELNGEDAETIDNYKKLADEHFKKAQESAGNLELAKAYGFTKEGLSYEKQSFDLRLDLHDIQKIIDLLGCDEK